MVSLPRSCKTRGSWNSALEFCQEPALVLTLTVSRQHGLRVFQTVQARDWKESSESPRKDSEDFSLPFILLVSWLLYPIPR